MFSSNYLICGIVLAVSPLMAEQSPGNSATPVSILVTVEGHKNSAHPEMSPQDVQVYQNGRRSKVIDWTPAQSAHGDLQLWVLIDDGSDTALGTQLSDLKKFVAAQPSTTEIGVGYLRNGSVEVGQNLSADHDLAAKAIRLPSGMAGISASPYLALIDLIEK
jgi:hypothetical protein